MLKNVKLLLTVFALIVCLLGVTACGDLGGTTPEGPVVDNEDLDTIAVVYQKAVEIGYEGTIEEFLELVKGQDGEDGLDGETPYIGADGNWWIGGVNTGVKAKGEDGIDGSNGVDGKDGLTPFIGENGNWWIGETDTGIPATGPEGAQGETGAAGADGKDGLTPFIGENGNWWIGETDTNVKAAGEDGKDGQDGVGIDDITVDEDGNLVITMTDGSVKNLGKIVGASAGFSEIRITEEKTLRITLNSGVIIETATLDIIFKGLVNGMSINEKGEMFVYTTIGITEKLGTIEKVYVNAEGEIIITFDTGDEVSFGKIYDVEGAACVHEYGEWVCGLAPTCTSIGYNVATCALCGDQDIEFVEALGHDFGDSYVIKEPVGEENGVQITACKVCGTAKMEFIDGFSRGLSYERTDKDEYRVTGKGTCKDEHIKVPPQHEGLPVTEIGEKAFYDCDDVVSITLPETIVKVHDKAFSDCDGLESVSMPDTAEIGTDVFRGSIHVEIIIKHILVFVEAKDATCTEPGNIAHWYCSVCDMYYEDEEQNVRLYDVVIPNAHDFVSGVCTKCGKVQDEILIVSIDTIAHLGKFPLGTLEGNIGLPASINVYTADGRVHALPVSWDLSDYDKSVAGEYTIHGIIQTGEFRYADGLTPNVEAELEIAEYMNGTADIVFVIDISGSMGGPIDNVKANIKSFAQAIEDKGINARWSVVTFSDYTINEPGEDSRIIMNGADTWFTSVDAYKSAIGSIYLEYGGDEPETGVDGLMLANTMETRKDARVFYVLVTDTYCKVTNNYGIGSLEEAGEVLANDGVNVSAVVPTSQYSHYSPLTSVTGGVSANINGNFAQTLLDKLVPIIYDEVIA